VIVRILQRGKDDVRHSVLCRQARMPVLCKVLCVVKQVVAQVVVKFTDEFQEICCFDGGFTTNFHVIIPLYNPEVCKNN
jgi:hypothetical protein